MSFKAIFDVHIITKFIVLSDHRKIIYYKHNEFVPLLVNQGFNKHEIFADLVAKSFL